MPLTSTQTTDCRLLSVDGSELNESTNLFPTRPRSSTCSGQNSLRYREQTPKKVFEERLRRRSWMACQASDMIVQTQQMNHFLRLRRFRLGQSEPNLTSLQMTSFYQTSPSVKTSPRTSSVAPSTFNSSRRSSIRRPNLSGLNLINLKHAFRKQLSPQQQPSEPSQEGPSHDDRANRRWSLTSAPSSSGYGTTSPPSSQYSSFERLQHINSNNSSSSSNNNNNNNHVHVNNKSVFSILMKEVYRLVVHMKIFFMEVYNV